MHGDGTVAQGGLWPNSETRRAWFQVAEWQFSDVMPFMLNPSRVHIDALFCLFVVLCNAPMKTMKHKRLGMSHMPSF